MWKVDWLSSLKLEVVVLLRHQIRTSKLNIFLKNFEVKLAAAASKFRPKTDIAIGVQATYKHSVVHNEPAKYHKF